MAYWIVQTLNALSFSVLLLLSGLGVSVVLSLMNFVNLAHGSAYLLGSYVAIVWLAAGLTWWLALPVAFLAAALAGVILDRWPFRRFYDRPHLMQVLLTYGLSVIFADLMRWGFGAEILSPVLPDALRGVIFVMGLPFPVYRLAVILAGGGLALGLWHLSDRTIWGAAIRAATEDRGIVETLGLDSRRIFLVVLALATGLGGAAGALGSGMLAAYPGLDEEVLLLALIVVVVGGLGSFGGTVASALLLGFVTTFARIWAPAMANVAFLAAAALVLILRPKGLLGRELRQV